MLRREQIRRHLGLAEPQGLMARQVLTSNSSGFSSDSTTDFALTVPTRADRAYRVGCHSAWSLSAVVSLGQWDVDLHIDGSLTERLARIDELAAITGLFNVAVLWLPTSGTHSLDVRVDTTGGTSTLTLNGSSTATRHFWVEDIGAR